MWPPYDESSQEGHLVLDVGGIQEKPLVLEEGEEEALEKGSLLEEGGWDMGSLVLENKRGRDVAEVSLVLDKGGGDVEKDNPCTNKILGCWVMSLQEDD